MYALDKDIYAFIKPSLDAHTLGINTAAQLLKECGYRVILGDENINNAIANIQYEVKQKLVISWLKENRINRIGLSYRLDQDEAIKTMGYFIHALKKNNMLHYQGGSIKAILFGGLPEGCLSIDKEYKGFVRTFTGGESVRQSLTKMGVPKDRIPKSIIEGSSYDDWRMEFGRDIIRSGSYDGMAPLDRSEYRDLGSRRDGVLERLKFNQSRHEFMPLIRAHAGPYSSNISRKECIDEFVEWGKRLASSGFLDILSIGTSQLTQSNFGDDWNDKPNGGGVPINFPEEYKRIYDTSRPLLLRTYAGTKDIPELAQMYEETINICWHALSLWWFNRLDGRGPYDLHTNLREHMKTMAYIGRTNKPFEANVPHHFAFRGADDVTYIVSAYLAAKLAKRLGIKTFILQNMLNTPRSTWGIQDLAKSRAMLTLVKSLEDEDFRVLLQPRAGLDYFKPDLEEAKIQLAAVTALMDDIDPHNDLSPPIIHVVSYSEASHLATPEVIDESIKITQYSLKEYRNLRRRGMIDDMGRRQDIEDRTRELIEAARTIIAGIESHIPNAYSPEGFYTIFAAGFLPVPYLWGEIEEFKHAKFWDTKPIKGGLRVVDEDRVVNPQDIVDYARGNIKDILKYHRLKHL